MKPLPPLTRYRILQNLKNTLIEMRDHIEDQILDIQKEQREITEELHNIAEKVTVEGFKKASGTH